MTIIGLLNRLAVRMSPQLTSLTTAAPPLPTTIPAIFTSFLRPNLRSSTTMSATSTAATPLDAIFKQKKALRSKVRKELESMDPALRSQEDDAIQKYVLEAPWFKSSKRLCAYISCALREVDTSKVLSEILKNTGQEILIAPFSNKNREVRKKLYVPRVEDKNSFMRMLNISAMDDLVANSMDILEPAPCDAEGNEREVGLAFDKSGQRIGRGGGRLEFALRAVAGVLRDFIYRSYYDTFLIKYQELAKDRKWKKPLFVALSYSRQILEDGVIPITPHDVPIDALVSSSGVIPITPAANEMCL